MNVRRRDAALVLGAWLALAGAACGDDSAGTSAAATTSTTSVGGGGAGGGAGGQGGAGGSGECVQPPSSGGVVMVPQIHECTSGSLTDLRGQAEVTIGYGFDFDTNKYIYNPACLVISPCTSVTFTATDGTNFSIHALIGGVFKQPLEDDPSSPFGTVDSAEQSEATFFLEEEGDYPYFCRDHGNLGMVGTIYVRE